MRNSHRTGEKRQLQKTKNSTNEATRLLKTQEGKLKTKLKRTENEP